MGTTTETKRVRAQKRRQRHHARAERRRRDRALVPVAVAQRLGIPVATLAHAMQWRSGGFDVLAQLPSQVGSP